MRHTYYRVVSPYLNVVVLITSIAFTLYFYIVRLRCQGRLFTCPARGLNLLKLYFYSFIFLLCILYIKFNVLSRTVFDFVLATTCCLFYL